MSGERAHLCLADGTVLPGFAFGAKGSTTGEAVFTTGMTGYEEVLTDPSYRGQIVTMTMPHIGNTGINGEDTEAVGDAPHVAGFVVRDASPVTSSWRSKESLDAYLARHGVVAITGVDTRRLTRHLRDQGSQNAAIGTEAPEVLVRRAREARDMSGLDLVREVTPKEPSTLATTTSDSPAVILTLRPSVPPPWIDWMLPGFTERRTMPLKPVSIAPSGRWTWILTGKGTALSMGRGSGRTRSPS